MRLLFPQDSIDTEMLLCAENVNQDNLLSYAREAADFATNYQLPSLDFAMNHYGQPDVAMFDFTSMYASENAALVRERQSHQLLVALVGDSLLEVPPAIGALSLPAFMFGCSICHHAAGEGQALRQLGGLRQVHSDLRACPCAQFRGAGSFCISQKAFSSTSGFFWADLFVEVQTEVAWSGLPGHLSPHV